MMGKLDLIEIYKTLYPVIEFLFFLGVHESFSQNQQCAEQKTSIKNFSRWK